MLKAFVDDWVSLLVLRRVSGPQCRSTRPSVTNKTLSHPQTALSSDSVSSSITLQQQMFMQPVMSPVPDEIMPIYPPPGMEMPPLGTASATSNFLPVPGMAGAAFAQQDVGGSMVMSTPSASTGFFAHGFNHLSGGATQWQPL